MRFPRAKSILLHSTCLPGSFGIGDFESGALACPYLDLKEGEPIHWVMIRRILSSIADFAINPFQDVLGSGSEGG